MGKLKDTTKEIKKVTNIALKNTAKEINYFMELQYEMAISAFYDDYTPKYYQRTYSTYYGSDTYENENKLNNPQSSGNGYMGGISVGASFIPGEPYTKGKSNRPTKDWVFPRTFINGIHGTSYSEKRTWGHNDYWNKYLRIMKGLNRKYKINQYTRFRNFGTGNKKIDVEKFNKEMDKQRRALGDFQTYKDFKTVNAVILPTYNYRLYQMVGSMKPKRMVDKAYKHISGKYNLYKLVESNIIRELTK